jgi:hypothetical protein
MARILEFEYPTLGTFAQALTIAEEALKREGAIPVGDALRKIGLKPTEDKISGSYYHKLDELCTFGLFKRESGILRVLPVATRACHPTDSAIANQGRAEAIRNNLPVVARLYDAWHGEIPEETAFPAKLEKNMAISWPEARKHTRKLRNLLTETFPYLFPYTGPKLVESEPVDKGELVVPLKQQPEAVSDVAVRPYGEVRTTVGSIVIRNVRQLKLARDLLDELEQQFSEREQEDQIG